MRRLGAWSSAFAWIWASDCAASARVVAGEADPKEIPASGDRYDNHYVTSEAWRRARAGE